jgi:hypothetical protein
VSYDLRNPGRDYGELYRYLNQFEHCHPLESLWLIDTAEAPSEVRDQIADIIDTNDGVLVIDVTGRASAWQKLNDACGDWIKAH